jgi:type II secretory ATPase GspE/PulE/Tfp pilus assembly ATPase PilB-like protein
VVATAAQITEAINKFYNIQEVSPVDSLIGEMGNVLATVEEDEQSEESMIVQPDSKMITFVNQVLIDAYKKGASDIHFEPGTGKEPFTIRYRVDGECYVAHRLDSTHKSGIISRLKIISELDIAERRRPQSGKIMLR